MEVCSVIIKSAWCHTLNRVSCYFWKCLTLACIIKRPLPRQPFGVFEKPSHILERRTRSLEICSCKSRLSMIVFSYSSPWDHICIGNAASYKVLYWHNQKSLHPNIGRWRTLGHPSSKFWSTRRHPTWCIKDLGCQRLQPTRWKTHPHFPRTHTQMGYILFLLRRWNQYFITLQAQPLAPEQTVNTIQI